MPTVFSSKGNSLWPLPRDYKDLTVEGRKKARVNAVSLRGSPRLEVASWAFLRSYYLKTLPSGAWYKHGTVRSPDCHYQWIYDWATYRLSITAAPRSCAKSTIVREKILKNLLVRKHWETVLFLAKQDFVSDALDVFMQQLENNPRIVEDFGKLKPNRNEGIWNHHQLKLKNGAMLTGMPIMGASLGKRPHEIVFDDVEKDDSMVLCPSYLIEAFQSLLFNVVFPMAEEGVAIRVIGTLLHRRTFLYWLLSTSDPRIADYWHRTLSAVVMTDPDTGDTYNLWEEKMGSAWQERQRRMMGHAAFAAQYMNDPGTEADRILRIHPELTTYWLEEQDEKALSQPLSSSAILVTHSLAKVQPSDPEEGANVPNLKKHRRSWGKAVSEMRRFITVDQARTTKETSDFSAVHCMGFENTTEFRDILYSLDLWVGKVRTDALVREIYKMAVKWGVNLVGVEQYGLQVEMYERIAHNLPAMFGGGDVPVRVFPIKFPSHYSKPDKIKGLEWRFSQNKIKLPIDRAEVGAYRALWYQIENFTEDMALLQNDDAIDTLAMHLAIGKSRGPLDARVAPPPSPTELWHKGEDDGTGIPPFSGVRTADIPQEVLEDLLDKRWEEAKLLQENDPFNQEIDLREVNFPHEFYAT